MRRYLENMHQREPHERRAHAMRVALALTSGLFFVWITTLGIRLTSQSAQLATESDQLANVLSGVYAPNELVVSTTTDY